MSYLKSSLIAGEKVVARAKHHWIMHFRRLVRLCFWLAVAAALLVFHRWLGDAGHALIADIEQIKAPHVRMVVFGFGALLAVLNVWGYVSFLLWLWSTEYAVTTRRVIMKNGLIRRSTFEVLLSQLETASVNQGLIGRLLDYGSFSLTATGGSRGSWHAINAPLWFKKKIEVAQEQLSKGGAPAGAAGQAPSAETKADGPGRFRIAGVKKASGEDAEVTLEAKSAANAKVKAELAGLVVTRVDRLGAVKKG